LAQAAGEQYHLYSHGSLAVGDQVQARLVSLPPAGEPDPLNFTLLLWLGGALTLLLASLVVLYLRRGNLALALGLIPAATPSRSAVALAPEELPLAEREAERLRLLRKLLRLERRRASGQLSAAQHRRQTQETRAALKAVLGASELTPLTPSPEREAGMLPPSSPLSPPAEGSGVRTPAGGGR
jgi:hypothetical protein